jgi:hypothetical protein
MHARPGLAPAQESARPKLPPVPEPTPPACDAADGELPYADAASPTEQKIALFRALFAGRTDVYATRWVSAKSGRTGWSPAEDNPFAKNKSAALTNQALPVYVIQSEQCQSIRFGARKTTATCQRMSRATGAAAPTTLPPP